MTASPHSFRASVVTYVATPSLNPRLLIVEDDPVFQQLLINGLHSQGYGVLLANDGPTALAHIREQQFDLMLLDLALPCIDGLAVCRALRHEQTTPIIVLSGNAQEAKKVTLLDAGADNYLVKPVSMKELFAHIRALLRRAGWSAPPTVAAPERYQLGAFALDVAQHSASYGGQPLQLTLTEWRLLLALCRHSGEALTHAQLAEATWPGEVLRDNRILQTHIYQLRKKLGTADLIETLHGLGYRLRA